MTKEFWKDQLKYRGEWYIVSARKKNPELELGVWTLCLIHHTCKQACWGSRLVPPPTVPISIDGMVQLIYKSSFVGPLASIKVIQFELPTFCAASWKKEKKKSTIYFFHSERRNKGSGGWRAHLSTGNVDGSDNVCCMGVVASYAPSHGRAH